MIPSWLRFRGDFFNGWEEDGEPDKKEVLTKEQKAIVNRIKKRTRFFYYFLFEGL